MHEYIDRDAFKNKHLCCGYLPEMSEEEFDAFPVAEVEQVVRCKDCKFSCISAYEHWCDNRNAPFYRDRSIQVKANDFCSYGKRRDNNV